MPRKKKVGNLKIGDTFHATSSAGRTLGCIIFDRDTKNLYCHRMTTTEYFIFDRENGISIGDMAEVSTIDCVEPLPTVMHDVMVALYERFRIMSRDGDATL